MRTNLVGALETMLKLQRWNSLPRLETWVEAENAAYVTHVGYALGRQMGLSSAQLRCLLMRSLLKSLNKHILTDVPVPMRERLNAQTNGAIWRQFVNDSAAETSRLFPRLIAEEIGRYLTDAPSYSVEGVDENDAGARARVEGLIEYARAKVAVAECQVNEKIFEKDYAETRSRLEERIKKISGHEEYDRCFNALLSYLAPIRQMKYLRRWNRVNRNVPTSVLGHTYVVSVVAISFCLLRETRDKLAGIGDDFAEQVMLRALFHDVPEGLTGDLIAPVKKRLAAINTDAWAELEAGVLRDFVKTAPEGVREDMKAYRLLKNLSLERPYSIDSLVKDSDILAAVAECLYEKQCGNIDAEMASAYESYSLELRRSEWSCVRDLRDVVSAEWEALRS